MHPLDGTAAQARWAARNIAYNLDFIPEDKLNWKPAESAKSALEVIAHVIGAIKSLQPVLGGSEWSPHQEPTPASAAVAKQALVAAADEFAEVLTSLAPESLQNRIELPFGTMSLAVIANMPVIDLIHHHGQIAYIQTLLGDTEDHFDMEALAEMS